MHGNTYVYICTVLHVVHTCTYKSHTRTQQQLYTCTDRLHFCICSRLELGTPLLLLRAWEPWRVRTTAGLGSSLVKSSLLGSHDLTGIHVHTSGLIITSVHTCNLVLYATQYTYKNKGNRDIILEHNNTKLRSLTKQAYRLDGALRIPLWSKEDSCMIVGMAYSN